MMVVPLQSSVGLTSFLLVLPPWPVPFVDVVSSPPLLLPLSKSLVAPFSLVPLSDEEDSLTIVAGGLLKEESHHDS